MCFSFSLICAYVTKTFLILEQCSDRIDTTFLCKVLQKKILIKYLKCDLIKQVSRLIHFFFSRLVVFIFLIQRFS